MVEHRALRFPVEQDRARTIHREHDKIRSGNEAAGAFDLEPGSATIDHEILAHLDRGRTIVADPGAAVGFGRSLAGDREARDREQPDHGVAAARSENTWSDRTPVKDGRMPRERSNTQTISVRTPGDTLTTSAATFASTR